SGPFFHRTALNKIQSFEVNLHFALNGEFHAVPVNQTAYNQSRHGQKHRGWLRHRINVGAESNCHCSTIGRSARDGPSRRSITGIAADKSFTATTDVQKCKVAWQNEFSRGLLYRSY